LFYVIGAGFILVGLLMVVKREAPPVGWGLGEHSRSRDATEEPFARGPAAVAIGIWFIFMGLMAILFG